MLWNELGAYVSQYHEALVDYMRRMHLSPTDPRGLAVVAHEVGRQAQMGAMLDVFKVITCSYIFMAAAGVPAEAQHHPAGRARAPPAADH